MSSQFVLKNKMIFVIADAAGGIYNSEQLKTLCAIADEDSAFLKISDDQRIGFMLDPERIPEVQPRLAQAGLLLRSYRNEGTPSPKACLGELCPLAEQDALGDALELSKALQNQFPAAIPYVTLGINGCGQACVASATDDIHIVAETTGYKITIGGQSKEIPQMGQFVGDNISPEKLGDSIIALLTLFQQNATPGERFIDVLERIGLSPFSEALEALQPSLLDESGLGSENDELLLDDSMISEDVSIENLVDFENLDLIDSETTLTEITEQNTGESMKTELEEASDFLDSPESMENISLDATLDSDLSVDELNPNEDSPEVELNRDENSFEEELTLDDVEEKPLVLKPQNSFIDTEIDTDSSEEEFTNHTQDENGLSAEDANSILMAEEDGLEIEEATTDDLDRVTSAIRSELAMDSNTVTQNPSPRQQAQNNQIQESLHSLSPQIRSAAPRAPLNSNSHLNSQTLLGGQSGVKIKMNNNELNFQLPEGGNISVDLNALSTLSAPLELEIEGQTLRLEQSGQFIQVKYGILSFTIPIDSKRLAA